MSDETGNGVFVLHSVSGCYAEVHISRKNFLPKEPVPPVINTTLLLSITNDLFI